MGMLGGMLGVAGSARAATHSGTAIAITAPTVNAPITISAIGTSPQAGVDNQGPGLVQALLADPASGQLSITASATTGNATLALTNAGSATVGVRALASGSGSPTASIGAHTAFASAVARTAVFQSAQAAKVAAATLDNTGALTIGAIAAAGSAYIAGAKADLGFGYYQQASGGTGASAGLTNAADATLTIAASAAVGSDYAGSAVAHLGQALTQSAQAGSGVAAATFSNAGSASIGAFAAASGGAYAYAEADLGNGLAQQAVGPAAAVSLTNTGVLAIGGKASASAGGSAIAFVSALGAIAQGAYAANGDAGTVLDNSGTLTISLSAAAGRNTVQATADAFGTALIDNTASATFGNAAATLTNSGELTVSAKGQATAAYAFAYATLLEAAKVISFATSGNAAATIDNSGKLTISLEADALGGLARANALGRTVLDEESNAKGGNATTAFTNAGTAVFSAAAAATGGSAAAHAELSHAAVVYASAVAGNATVQIANSGSFAMQALGHADASAQASATARIFSGIRQTAYAQSGVATLALTNSGTMAFVAQAVAAQSATGTHPAHPAASASAVLDSAVLQRASGSASLFTIDVTNSGTLALAATAKAISTGAAYAEGAISRGIFEYAHPYGTANGYPVAPGAASVALTNSGTIGVVTQLTAAGQTAQAGWSGSGFNIAGGIVQKAIGASGNASVALDNQADGTILIAAQLDASGVQAAAFGRVGGAIVQQAAALSGTATISLTNAGTIDIAALAGASGAQGAVALALAQSAVTQGVQASASAAGTALANTLSIDNSGSLGILAHAQATGNAGTGLANAIVANGIAQSASLGGGGAESVTALLTNSGDVTVAAMAQATGADAQAQAVVDGGITSTLRGRAASGSAAAMVANSGTITVGAVATALGGASAQATAAVTSGIVLDAGLAAGDVAVSLTNSGTITIGASAIASANGGFNNFREQPGVARALVSDGILLQASAAAGSATASLDNSGTIDISALARDGGNQFNVGANVRGSALAGAAAVASGGDAAAAVSNSGTMKLLAQADGGFAYGKYVKARLDGGLYAVASAAGGNALGSIDNSGKLTIAATAVAGSGVGAGARAMGTHLIGVGATAAGGSANASLANSGTIALSLTALVPGSVFYGSARVSGNDVVGLGAKAAGGAAVTAVTNSGTLNVLADAEVGSAADAQAHAFVQGGLTVSARASGSDARASFANTGTFGLTVQALAGHPDGAGRNQVMATATLESAVLLRAGGSNGTYAVDLANTGSLTISQVVHAVVGAPASGVGSGPATAHGLIYGAINEIAHPATTANGALASVGAAAVGLENSGTITIASDLVASGPVAQAGGNFTRNDGSNGQGGILDAVLQGAVGGGDASASFSNADGGTLDISAHAVALSQGSNGRSVVAEVDGGLVQYAVAINGSANATITNAGTIGVNAEAVGLGSALVHQGIYQRTLATNSGSDVAAVSLNNSGSLTLGAVMVDDAAGNLSYANARLRSGIEQSATAFGAQTTTAATLTNSGTLTLAADAVQIGANPYAFATLESGVVQSAFGQAGPAHVAIGNSGTLSLVALAQAGNAQALIGNAIRQSATAASDAASAAIDNTGTLTIAAVALNGNGLLGSTVATNRNAIAASASAAGTASASAGLNNAGTLIIAANAAASQNASQANRGVGSANLFGGVSLLATGSAGSIGASLNNSGTLTIAANGQATVAGEGGQASGVAYLANGIYEAARSSASSGTAMGAGASVALSNTGTIAIGVTQSARGSGAVAGPGFYSGDYNVRNAIEQSAVLRGGTVSEAIDNAEGATVAISDDANAFGIGAGIARAGVAGGIVQTAGAIDGIGSIALDNAGTLDLSARAYAAGQKFASAFATLSSGLVQSLTVVPGAISSAAVAADTASLADTVQLTNSGTIDIAAIAKASALSGVHGLAVAGLGGGIEQGVAVSGSAPATAAATLTNSGTIAAVAAAHVQAGASNSYPGFISYINGYAVAGADGLIRQTASNTAGNASVELANSGTLSLAVMASANAVTAALADAEFGGNWLSPGAIGQNVQATGSSGDATATLANNGTIQLTALANAIAAAGSAHALAGDRPDSYYAGAPVISQNVFAESGNAVATFGNGGTIHIAGSAAASGAGGADAQAGLEVGLVQRAITYGSSTNTAASAVLLNAGGFGFDMHATARGGSGNAYASARMNRAVAQSAAGYGAAPVTASLDNGALMAFDVNADAAGAGVARASADVLGVGQTASGDGMVKAMLVNSGTLQVTAEAKATGQDAQAWLSAGAIDQTVTGSGSTGADVYNSGKLLAIAAGTATGTGTAVGSADAFAVRQNGHGIGTTTLSVENAAEGMIGVSATLGLTAPQGSTNDAIASVVAHGVGQAYFGGGLPAADATSAPAGTAMLSVANAGRIVVDATLGAALGASAGKAVATATGVYQYGGDAAMPVGASLDNSGTLIASASVTAGAGVGTADAYATGWGGDGIGLAASLTNTGTIGAVAKAAGAASSSLASAAAVHLAASSALSLTATNSGSLMAQASAAAASGSAKATGLGLRGPVGSFALTNSGAISAMAKAGGSARAVGVKLDSIAATSSGSSSASVRALAAPATTFALTNTGTIVADARLGAAGTGRAGATGVQVGASSALSFAVTNGGMIAAVASAPAGIASATGFVVRGPIVAASLTNTGTITANATGSAAFASGVAIHNSASATAPVPTIAAPASGLMLTNSGTISATAKAIGAGSGAIASAAALHVTGPINGAVTNSGMIAAHATAPAAGIANARGIELAGGPIAAHLTNTGTILATASGGSAQAYGIVAGSGSSPLARPMALRSGAVPADTTGIDTGAVLTIDNTGGSIIAKVGSDGSTWTHGVAIDTTASPNPAVINLSGNGAAAGYVYGDINIGAADTINVANGATSFDGAINDDGGQRGTLNIAANGTLDLLALQAPAPSAALSRAALATPAAVPVGSLLNLANFNVAGGGTLIVQQPTGPTNGPLIGAGTATISPGATLVVQVHPNANGLYANSTLIDVLAAGELSGTFSTFTVSNGSALLSLDYDPACGANTICVDLVRRSFANPVGATLNANQAAVGAALDAGYSPAATGPYAALLATLLAQTSGAAVAGDLSQLSGAQYADWLQGLKRLGGSFDGALLDAGSCALASTDRHACRSESAGRIWGAMSYDTAKQSGDALAPGSRDQITRITVGTDVNVGDNVALGIGGGWVHDQATYTTQGGALKADGLQVGGYAVWDNGRVFTKSAISFTGIDGTSQRSIAIGSGAGAIAGTESGKVSARMWTVSGELGVRMGAPGSQAEPYARVDWTSARLSGVAEHGVPGADLTAPHGSSVRAVSELGLRYALGKGTVHPSFDLGWRHLFGSNRATYDAAFVGAPGADFGVVSAAESRDSARVGAGLTASLPHGVVVRVGYQGDFGGRTHSNGVRASLVVPLGR